MLNIEVVCSMQRATVGGIGISTFGMLNALRGQGQQGWRRRQKRRGRHWHCGTGIGIAALASTLALAGIGIGIAAALHWQSTKPQAWIDVRTCGVLRR